MGKSIEVILTDKVEGLGVFGQQKRVKSGYARNYLIPNQLALYVTRGNLAIFKEIEIKEKKKQEEAKKTALEVQKKIDGKVLTFSEKARESGKLYGSITVTKIASEIESSLGVTLDKQVIQLANPIKEVGDYPLTLQLTDDVSLTLNVSVKASEKVDSKK